MNTVQYSTNSEFDEEIIVCGIPGSVSVDFTGKVFLSTPEDTGTAYTQMKLQHRSSLEGPWTPLKLHTAVTVSVCVLVSCE